jgi:non-specific serine/threonine protein kinase
MATLNESVRLSRQFGERAQEGIALAHMARARIASDKPAEGPPYLDLALPILREAGQPADLAVALMYWGLAAIFNDQPNVAIERLTEGIATCQKIGFRSLGARARMLLASARLDSGDPSVARSLLAEALPTAVELGDQWIIPLHMCVFAGVAAATGHYRRALMLAGFAAAYSTTHDFNMPLVMRTRLKRWLAPAHQALGSAADAVSDEGARMTLDEAVAFALAKDSNESSASASRQLLTARELEVARLVAMGLTNRQIAERLYLSVRTVDVHVDHILTKLSFNTRTQLASWAYETNLLPK